jgi:hypothetical protein
MTTLERKKIIVAKIKLAEASKESYSSKKGCFANDDEED